MKKTMIMMVCMAFMQALIGQTHWTPVSGIQNNMTVSAVLYVNGEEQHADYVEIGAFCGEDCRAAALPYEVEGEQVYFLTIRGNAGEAITFRLYDHQLQAELDYVCEQTYTFVVDDILGEWPDWYPIRFNTPISTTVQTVELSAGWNWFSTYIEADPIELLQMLEESLGEHGIVIKGGDITTEYDEEWGWFGDLDELGIVNEQMYLVRTVAACTVVMEGTPANPADHAITINPGWNWIGFPCSVSVDIEDAFSGFNATPGDILKCGDISTEYDEEWGWFGDIETLIPGYGYLYFSNASTPKTLVFQTGAKNFPLILFAMPTWRRYVVP